MTNTLPIKDTTKQLASLASKIASLTNDIEPDSTETFTPAGEDSVDIFTSGDPETNLSQPRTTLTSSASNSLFNSLHIYISRETPGDALTFLLCFHVSSLSTDPTAGPSPYSESDTRITHQICDRGKLPANLVPGRKYVQPQWVVDSINRCERVDESAYLPGAELPAHLSPFVEKQDWKYDPEAPLDVESESEVEQEGDEKQEHQRLVVAEAAGEQAIEKKTKKKKKAVVVVNGEKEAKEMAKIRYRIRIDGC
jgi:pescadillo protein